MITQDEFLDKYAISRDQFEATNLNWKDLAEIHGDHEQRVKELEPTAIQIAERIRSIKPVHSIKYRIKDPEHLLEKIIRKRIDKPDVVCDISNYRATMQDLIGVRALHLFKDEWKPIHEFITRTWDLVGNPTANIRKGDSVEHLKEISGMDFDINEHKFGYRSIHYIVSCQPIKEVQFAELQIRTIFEEGWSEIDHKIRYPYDTKNETLNEYLAVFNRLAGSADEMGTFVKNLQAKLSEYSETVLSAITERDKALEDLKGHIKKLKISDTEMKKLNEKVAKLEGRQITSTNVSHMAPATVSILDMGKIASPSLYLVASMRCATCGISFQPDPSMVFFSNQCPECRKKSFTSVTSGIGVMPNSKQNFNNI